MHRCSEIRWNLRPFLLIGQDLGGVQLRLDAEGESYVVPHEEGKLEGDGLMTALAAVAVAEEDASCMTG